MRDDAKVQGVHSISGTMIIEDSECHDADEPLRRRSCYPTPNPQMPFLGLGTSRNVASRELTGIHALALRLTPLTLSEHSVGDIPDLCPTLEAVIGRATRRGNERAHHAR